MTISGELNKVTDLDELLYGIRIKIWSDEGYIWKWTKLDKFIIIFALYTYINI